MLARRPSPSPPSAAGIVLAAGGSTRMGRPKPMLRSQGRTFLQSTISALADGGCVDVVAVLRPDPEAVREASSAGARVVLNQATESQQIDSLRLGLEALDDTVEAAVALPVDHPLVRAETVAALIERLRDAPSGIIVRPVHDGRPGHPTLFPRAVWPALMAPLPQGARSVVEDGRHPMADVLVDDPGVVADIDTPEAYERWIGTGRQ